MLSMYLWLVIVQHFQPQLYTVFKLEKKGLGGDILRQIPIIIDYIDLISAIIGLYIEIEQNHNYKQ